MIINSFSIIDFKNKEAEKFEFKSGSNLVISDKNTQGKSSLLKSMYFTLGFDVRQFPANWNINDMYFQLEVRINNSNYTITRQNNIFRVSDKAEPMNVKEYSEWFQMKLNANMKLANTRTKSLYDAYSSALILPFYIDQDDSWDGGMYKNVTDTLNQYARIPEDIFKSIFSISSLEILELQNLVNNYTKEKSALESGIQSLIKVLEEYKEENINTPTVSKIDKEALKNDIKNYLLMQNELNEQITNYKIKLLNKQEILDLQKQELSELNQLLLMNRKRYRSIEAECRYCHSKLTTEQSLTRLDLSNNYFEISLLKDEVEKEIKKLTTDINEFKSKQSLVESSINEVHRRIEKSKEMLTIDEYVKATVKNEAIHELENLINKQVVSKENFHREIKDLNKDIRRLKKEKQFLSDDIEKNYNILLTELKSVLTDIDITDHKFLDFKKINGSGMNKNKKYLAYYLIYFSLLKKYSSYSIPFCIDSFIKNEITGESSKEMFKAIEQYFFDNDNQSFFSIVSENLKYLEHLESYNKVKLNGRLLSKSKYQEISTKFNFNG